MFPGPTASQNHQSSSSSAYTSGPGATQLHHALSRRITKIAERPVGTDADRATRALDALEAFESDTTGPRVGTRSRANAVVYSQVIALLGRAGMGVRAFKLLQRMRKHGVDPNGATYTALFRAMSLAGGEQVLDRAVAAWESMRRDVVKARGKLIDVRCLNSFVGVCARAGDIDTAIETAMEALRDEVVRPDIRTVTVVLACARDAGEPDAVVRGALPLIEAAFADRRDPQGNPLGPDPHLELVLGSIIHKYPRSELAVLAKEWLAIGSKSTPSTSSSSSSSSSTSNSKTASSPNADDLVARALARAHEAAEKDLRDATLAAAAGAGAGAAPDRRNAGGNSARRGAKPRGGGASRHFGARGGHSGGSVRSGRGGHSASRGGSRSDTPRGRGPLSPAVDSWGL
jgi:pentatricopeptide repeat protein